MHTCTAHHQVGFLHLSQISLEECGSPDRESDSPGAVPLTERPQTFATKESGGRGRSTGRRRASDRALCTVRAAPGCSIIRRTRPASAWCGTYKVMGWASVSTISNGPVSVKSGSSALSSNDLDQSCMADCVATSFFPCRQHQIHQLCFATDEVTSQEFDSRGAPCRLEVRLIKNATDSRQRKARDVAVRQLRSSVSPAVLGRPAQQKKRALEIRSRWEANKSAVQKKHTKKEKVAVRYCPQEYLERRKAHVPKFQAFRAVLLLELFCCYLHGPY